MFDIQKGMRRDASAPTGLELFREPPVNSKASDQENIILSLPEGADFLLEVVDILMIEGEKWCSVLIIVDDYEIPGWVKRDSFEVITPFPATGGQGVMPCYIFQFTGNMYSISYENLNVATLGEYKYIDFEPKTNLQSVSIDKTTYYTNPKNIDDMKTAKLVTFIKKL